MTQDKEFLSIGEVLGLLLEEFPDVTISKIRFLESQGLIEPERTTSGYRKFSSVEVERLKFILREQRENYLPLKVIRTRLDEDASEEYVRSDETTPPRGLGHIPTRQTLDHPASRRHSESKLEVVTTRSEESGPSSYGRKELIAAASTNEKTLVELEKYGLIKARQLGNSQIYDDNDLMILAVCAKMMLLGIEARHLKAWQRSASQEVSLFESRIVPMMRQKNPTARMEAQTMYSQLVQLGESLRAALVATQTKTIFK